MEFSRAEGKQLLETFAALGVKPNADSPEDLQDWMIEHLKASGRLPVEVKGEHTEAKDLGKASAATGLTPSNPQWPRLSTFSGDESNRADASFDLWKYEVTCLLEGKLHSEETIRQSIRRSLRGQAARVAMHLGPLADSSEILRKLEGVYGSVEVGQALLSEFYAARQKKDEDVVSWGCRLEDMIDRARKQGLVPEREANEMLRTQFWTNLHQKLKDSSRHKFDMIKDFDRLRVEIRAIEREYKSLGIAETEEANKEKKATQSQRAMATTSEQPSETETVKELTGMVHKLSAQLESVQQQMQAIGQAQQGPSYPRMPPQLPGGNSAPYKGCRAR